MTEVENEVVQTTEEFGGGDIFETPSLSLPKATPEIHQGVVVSVTTKTSENTGTTYGIITVQSQNTGLTFEFPFFPPAAWFDAANWGAKGFDPETLSTEVPVGKKLNAQQLFAMSVSSADAAVAKDGTVITQPVPGKDAPLQLLLKLARLEGFTPEAGTTRPTDGESYIAAVNSLVAGRLEVLFTRRPTKNDDPRFDGQLKVAAILPKTDADLPNFGKRFQNYRKMWEVQ